MIESLEPRLLFSHHPAPQRVAAAYAAGGYYVEVQLRQSGGNLSGIAYLDGVTYLDMKVKGTISKSGAVRLSGKYKEPMEADDWGTVYTFSLRGQLQAGGNITGKYEYGPTVIRDGGGTYADGTQGWYSETLYPMQPPIMPYSAGY